MTDTPPSTPRGTPGLSRRQILKLGGGAAGAVALAGSGLLSGTASAATRSRWHGSGDDDQSGSSSAYSEQPASQLPKSKIEQALQVEGQITDNLLMFEVDRNDMTNVVNSAGQPIKPSFELNGTIYFEALSGHQAIVNADMAFKESEIDAAIDAMVANGIVMQAFHQHVEDWEPDVWFMHFRCLGDPLKLASGVAAIIHATSTPLPQSLPSNPTTPLPADQLGKIFGATPQIGSDGVVTIDVPRKEQITLGCVVPINPYLNVATNIGFEPLGNTTLVVPDFAMVASEIMPVMAYMRARGWQVGCLYNQETAENPQLYFSHQQKSGDAVQLAWEIRGALALTNSQL